MFTYEKTYSPDPIAISAGKLREALYGPASPHSAPASPQPHLLPLSHSLPHPRRDPMSTPEKTYTIDQIAVAARELREAAGADPERFSSGEVASLLAGEIEILRQRGFTDDRIADLISGFEIEIKPRQIERRSRTPFNLIRRLLWGRLRSNKERYRLQPE